MLDQCLSPAEIVGRLRDGMTLGIGGWGPRRKPMALVREIFRSPLKNLTVVAGRRGDLPHCADLLQSIETEARARIAALCAGN